MKEKDLGKIFQHIEIENFNEKMEYIKQKTLEKRLKHLKGESKHVQ